MPGRSCIFDLAILLWCAVKVPHCLFYLRDLNLYSDGWIRGVHVLFILHAVLVLGFFCWLWFGFVYLS